MPGFNRLLAATLASASLALCVGSSTTRAQASFSYAPIGDAAADVPGAPRTPILIYRRLLEDGYELSAPVVQDGPVDVADVKDRQSHALCLVLDSFNGTILQSLAFTPQGLRALNEDAPGPGFPGFPPFADGRYANACYVALSAAAIPQRKIIQPLPLPAPPHVIARIRRRAVVRRPIKPACGPYQPRAKKQPLRPNLPIKHVPPRAGLCVRPPE